MINYPFDDDFNCSKIFGVSFYMYFLIRLAENKNQTQIYMKLSHMVCNDTAGYMESKN